MNNLNQIAKPYLDIYIAITTQKEVKMEDDDIGVYTAIPHAIDVAYSDLFTYLHNGTTDYIYIETLKENCLVTGLLCTENDRNLSDTDSCFFIGKIGNDFYLLSGMEFREYFSVDAKFTVSLPIVVEKVLVDEIREKAFLDAVRRMVKC